jgi:CDP-diacylglycerol---glycerol-3-phosphate 3-phosphatidyltransferase
MSEHPITLSDRARNLTKGVMARIGMTLHKAGIHPDIITIVGLLIVGIAALFISKDEMQVGAIILLAGLPLDAIDGAVARAMERKSRFGEMLDSSLDRYADGLIFMALSYHFAVQDEFDLMLLAMAALMGSFMVSYARARAEGVGVDVKIGLFTRMERLITIFIMLLVPALLIPGLWILAIGTNFTAMQRLWFVYKTLKQRETE